MMEVAAKRGVEEGEECETSYLPSFNFKWEKNDEGVK